MLVHVNSFVLRQTPESGFSHYEGHPGCDCNDTWGALKDLVKEAFEAGAFRAGYRSGVVLVSVEPYGFYSSVVKLVEGDVLHGLFRARRKGEEPRKSVGVLGAQKMPAKAVEVVLYASTVLAEGGDNELPAEPGNWEIVSINANPVEGTMPIEPDVLMHNHFGSDGGTATGLSDADFVAMLRESFLFWKDKSMLAPK